MFPTEKQVDTYFKNLTENCNDLNLLLTQAQLDLTNIFTATDKPVKVEESLAGMVLEGALGLTFPEGKVFFSFVNHMIEGAKKMKEKADEVRKYLNVADKALDELTESASEVSTAYGNGALDMTQTVNNISDKIFAQKALAMQLGEVFQQLRGVKTAEPLFNSIQWASPPAMVSKSTKTIRYIFVYILVRLAFFRSVRLNMHSQPNGIGLGLTQLLVTKITPEGVSEKGCKYIFDHFTKSFPNTNSTILPGRNIVPIYNYYDMIDNWYPDIDISDGSYEEQAVVMGDPKKYHFTDKMYMIASGMKKVLPEVVMTPEFQLRASR